MTFGTFNSTHYWTDVTVYVIGKVAFSLDLKMALKILSFKFLQLPSG